MLIKPNNPNISAEEALSIAMQKLNEQAQYIDKLEKEIERLKNEWNKSRYNIRKDIS